MKHSIELTIVGLIILCCACAAHCDETNKVAPTLSITTTGSVGITPPGFQPTQELHVAKAPVSDTVELKTDGPLSHFRLYGIVETQKVVIRQELTVVDVVTSNTYMHVYAFDDTAKAWRTNSKIPSAIAPVMLPPVTNVVVTP